MKEKRTMAESEMFRLLMKIYGDREGWALLAQVPDGTGYNKRRTADAVAVSLWPSRGYEIHGFEMKSSRADLLSELKKPGKADRVARYCDYWWLVVSEPGIAEPGEIPKLWGLMVVEGDELKVVKKPTRIDAEDPDIRFLAGVLRAAAKSYVDRAELARSYNTGYEAGKLAGNRSATKSDGKAERELESLRQRVSVFENASGVKVDSWDAENVGHAVRMVLAKEHGSILRQVNILRSTCNRILEMTQEAAP